MRRGKGMQSALGLCAMAFLFGGCAASGEHAGKPSEQHASAQQAKTAAHEDAELASTGRASDHLAMGVALFHGNQRAKAAAAFKRALETGNLNNQGRALAYWHLFLANREGDVTGAGAEALDSFLTVSLLLFEEERELPDVEAQSVREFIHGFNLAERMLLAELVLDALWARRDPHYGRSPQRPVKVRSSDAERLFVQLFRPCAAAETAPSVQHEEIDQLGVRIDQVSFTCPGESTSGQFYFSTR